MEIILLAVIATILATKLLNDVTKGEHPILLVVAVPFFTLVIGIGTLITLLFVSGINWILEFFNIYLN